MTTNQTRLDDICDDIGIIAFLRWKGDAHRAWADSEYFYKGADAKHAFEYEHIRRRYDTLVQHRKVFEETGRIE